MHRIASHHDVSSSSSPQEQPGGLHASLPTLKFYADSRSRPVHGNGGGVRAPNLVIKHLLIVLRVSE